MKHQLSKSTFMRGINCEKSLYLNKYKGKLRDALTEQQESIFSQGTKVGELAQELFPGGIDLTPASFHDFGPSILATQKAIKRKEPIIYEAAFLYDGILAAIDILVKTDRGYKAYEVKSSTEVKQAHLKDIALQNYVIENSGLKLEDISLIYINNAYVKKGSIELQKLFTTVSVRKTIQKYMDKIPNQVLGLKKVLDTKKEPKVPIGLQCHAPYTCDFVGHCWKHVPEYSVMNINNLSKKKRFDLLKKGVTFVHEVPDAFDLGTNQRLQVEAEKNGTAIVDHSRIEEFLSELSYPLYHLDFETFGHAVPVFDNSRPYQQLVFQYSLHVQSEAKAPPVHYEYLGTSSADPRPKFIEQLIDQCGTHGDILVYNISFEKGKINDLILAFPSYATPLNGIIARLKDLMIPFKSKWYYLPAMQGSYSIKKVLPAVVPTFKSAYTSLVIQDGGTASLAFAQMVDGSYSGSYSATRADLLEYCKLDTLAMVEIVNALYALKCHRAVHV